MRLFKPNVTKMEAAKDVNGLIKALKDSDRWIRRAAAEALGGIGDARAVEPLIQALKDRDVDVRKAAANALGKFGKPAVRPLIRALKDMDVRKAAAGVLQKLGWQPDSTATKVSYLIALEEWDELVKLGEPAVESLIEALKDTTW